MSSMRLRLLLLTFLCSRSLLPGFADEPPKYSDEVVAKAERILGENGLKRVGGQIQTSNHNELTRLFAEETKTRRTLRQLRSGLNEQNKTLELVQAQLETLETQVGLWSAQYAAQGNAGGQNNELVARINAGNVQLKQLARNRDAVKEALKEPRAELGRSEESYAEMILKMRTLVEKMRETCTAAKEVKDVGIALQVLATRYPSPAELDINAIIDPLDRRVRKLEEAVFQETIPLDGAGGGLSVQAVVGLEPVSMLVDSGASLVLVPQELAQKLQLKPEADAKELTMVTADGRRIQAKEIFLPRIRVGKFTAENVRAALLVESVPGARPLLGLSFLEKFRFEIDANQKQLTLLEIKEADNEK